MQKAASISCGVYPSLQPNVAVVKVTFWMKPLAGGSGVEQLMASIVHWNMKDTAKKDFVGIYHT